MRPTAVDPEPRGAPAHVGRAPERNAAAPRDGVFLFHPALRDLWDLKIFLDRDREFARERGIARDADRMENAREKYANRYVPGETAYLEEVDPRSLADLVVSTT